MNKKSKKKKNFLASNQIYYRYALKANRFLFDKQSFNNVSKIDFKLISCHIRRAFYF